MYLIIIFSSPIEKKTQKNKKALKSFFFFYWWSVKFLCFKFEFFIGKIEEERCTMKKKANDEKNSSTFQYIF